jgi:LmbE family N-acetylglucosaminyl deacetylase
MRHGDGSVAAPSPESSAQSSAQSSALSAVSRAALLLPVVLFLLAPGPLRSQERGAVALSGVVDALGNSARVLMIGAHPDDEDTNLLAWLARGRGVETAYLSLTRGDGGQNLIGNELGEALGVIRTEELLAARRIDGARQFFTRAYDFGFSKSAEETFRHWPREELLRDVVTVVRAFRPHVIVSVFSGTPRDGHGHHQVAGILAREAFDIAGDTVRMPRDRTRWVGPWTPLKFYRGQRGNAQGATVGVNVGEYDAVIGRSYAEIAGLSRSQHQSQGFGALQRRGPVMNYLRLETSRAGPAGDGAAERSIFDGVDTTWGRFTGLPLPPEARIALDSIPVLTAAAREKLDLRRPEVVTPLLSRLLDVTRDAMQAIYARQPAEQPRGVSGPEGCFTDPDPICAGVYGDLLASLGRTASLSQEALVESVGLSVDALATRPVVAEGDTIEIDIEVFNQGSTRIELTRLLSSMGSGGLVRDTLIVLGPDSAFRQRIRVKAGWRNAPWWTEQPRIGDMFQLAEMESPVGPWPPGVASLLQGETVFQGSRAWAMLDVGGRRLDLASPPVSFRYVDPTFGERRRPLSVVPPVTVLLDQEVEYVPARTAIDRELRVTLRSAARDTIPVQLWLQLPSGLRTAGTPRRVVLAPGTAQQVAFRIRGVLPPGMHEIAAVAESAAGPFEDGYVEIDYPHIRPQRIYRRAVTWLSSVDVVVPRETRVAYVRGVGDNVPPMLVQLGIPVTTIDAGSFANSDLARYTTVVVGPRAFEAHPELRAAAPKLLEFARAGGRVVVQYGQYEMQQPGILPYAITINRPHDRVTGEDVPVTIVSPGAPALRTPNRITAADFEGWVQERSVYMPRTFDERYEALLEMSDPGEPPNRGSILIARVGSGSYVYTTLAFFRQLPAGVPGAARLFVNLLAGGAAGR